MLHLIVYCNIVFYDGKQIEVRYIMSLKDVFKENVKYYRKQLKLTQESLAKLSGVSTNYIGEIERTGRKATLETIEKVANGLNIDPSLLLVSRKKDNEQK
jgi:Predicted transcriptional regulator with C-terminal CBS domains